MTEGTRSLFSVSFWREGRHAQIDLGRVSFWLGYAADRWMVGLIFNHEALNLGIGLGPFYAGIGAAYDR